MQWNIAGNIFGENPNILSELEWSNLETKQVTVSLRSHKKIKPIIKCSFNYGWIYHGSCRDSDYLQNNRNQEFSRIICNAGNGNMWDVSIGVGYPLLNLFQNLHLNPFVGYSFHQQRLTLYNGHQAVNSDASLHDLNSSYRTTWNTLWGGVELVFNFPKAPQCTVSVDFEYHFADYNGKANWNLRSDFAHPKSFEHDSDGRGCVLSMVFEYQITPKIGFAFLGSWQDWDASRGIDRLFLAEGRRIDTQLNSVEWDSYAVQFGFVLIF